MDAAEKWLNANDPSYALSARAWKHIDENGEYRTPREELPVGGLQEISTLVDAGAKPVGNTTAALDRACVRCNQTFVPWDGDQKYCGDLCRAAARRDYNRARMQRQRSAA